MTSLAPLSATQAAAAAAAADGRDAAADGRDQRESKKERGEQSKEGRREGKRDKEQRREQVIDGWIEATTYNCTTIKSDNLLVTGWSLVVVPVPAAQLN